MIDLFGNEVPEPLPERRGGKKYRTMQQMYGAIEGKTCKTCSHCVGYKYGKKTYYKCELWYVTSSEATDIRLKNIACKRYKE